MSPEPRALSTLTWAVRGEGPRAEETHWGAENRAPAPLGSFSGAPGHTDFSVQDAGESVKVWPHGRGTQQPPWHSPSELSSRKEMEKGFDYCLLSKNSAV